MTAGQRSVMGDKSKLSSNTVNHDMWVRRKEHELKLKENLIREAKKDYLE